MSEIWNSLSRGQVLFITGYIVFTILMFYFLWVEQRGYWKRRAKREEEREKQCKEDLLARLSDNTVKAEKLSREYLNNL